MTDRYWISNIIATANTAGNWNTVADGSGSTGVPTTGDDVFFGHATTLTANLGNGPCVWDLAVTLGTITTTDDYVGFTHTATNISFTAPNTITMTDGDWLLQGFRVGMEIRVSGAANAANNNAFTILSITDNVILTTSVAIVTEAAGPSISVLYEASIDLHAHIDVNLLILKNNLQNTSGSKKTISFAGTYDASADSRYILNGENASISNQDHIEYSLDSSANGVAPLYFDDGPYPLVTITSATRWSCGYKAPSSGVTGVVTMYGLTVGTSTTMAVDSTATPVQNESKVFSILNTSTFLFSPTATAFEAGKSTWSFNMDATNFTFPVSDDTKTYYWYNVILATPKTAGFKTTIASNRTLSVNSLTVEADAVLEGHKTLGGPTSTVVSVRRPKILGAWNFSQISDGIYASLIETAYPITPASGPVGRVQVSNGSGAFTNDEKLTWTSATSTLLVDGKLTVTGLIDPTGMEFTAVGANPSSANPDKTIWVNSGDSNKLYFGSSEVGGGGGSGTVTSVAVSGSDGIQVDSGSPITTNGTIALGVDKNTLLSHINVEDGADVTDATNVTAAGALMDSEVTNLAQVKAFDSTDYATATQGTTANNALPKAGGTMTGEIEATTITLNAVPADPATDDKVRIGESGGTSNMFQIRTNDGYMQMGPNNSGYCHIQTDRSRFYFNKEIIIDGGGYLLAYDDGLKLGTGTSSGSATTAITIADGSTDIAVAGSISEGGTALSAKYGPAIQIMKWTKTGSINIPNLPHDIASGQKSLIDVGSVNWIEDTAGTTHAAIAISPDYGIQFLQSGIYRIDTGFYFQSSASVTAGVVCAMEATTSTPDPAQTGWVPSSYSINMGYNRLDVYLSAQNLSTDPDFNMVFNISAPTTVYLFGEVSNLSGGATWRIRHHATAPLSQVTVTRIGDVQV